jgi:hypothetical protein
MQDIMCYSGQEKVFEQASETIERLLLIEVNSKQIERLCHHYGQRLEDEQSQSIESGAEAKSTAGAHYVMVDGSLIFTRQEGWKEIKLGRVFAQDSSIEINKGRHQIQSSQYIAHLGTHHDFCKKMEFYLDDIAEKIFIADGARWIWNWAAALYPKAVQILDFFHAKEHLCDFAELSFPDNEQRQEWIDQQSLLLLNDRADQVISNLTSLQISNRKVKKSRCDLIKYYQVNMHRMQYKTFKEKGWMIGSGPIESAHRHVVQQRLKLSGQRWTIKGAQQVVNLRAVHKSNKWSSLLNLIKNAA